LCDAIFIVFTSWYLEFTFDAIALDVSAESNVATSIFGSFNVSFLSLGACCQLGAFGLGTSNFSISVTLTVCAGFW
jgi:hypothetical protein